MESAQWMDQLYSCVNSLNSLSHCFGVTIGQWIALNFYARRRSLKPDVTTTSSPKLHQWLVIYIKLWFQVMVYRGLSQVLTLSK